jgi:hypothetical protein
VAYLDNRSLVASDTFDSSISGEWDNGFADWDVFTWQSGGGLGVVEPGVGDSAMRRNMASYTGNHWSRVISGANGANTCGMGGIVRVHPTSGTDESCYWGLCEDEAANVYQIYERDSAFGLASLTSTAWGTAPYAIGDSFTMEAEGTTLRSGSAEGGADTQRLTTTDATLNGATYFAVGFAAYFGTSAADARVHAWEGGSISPPGARIANVHGQPMLRGPY